MLHNLELAALADDDPIRSKRVWNLLYLCYFKLNFQILIVSVELRGKLLRKINVICIYLGLEKQ